jgi:hypothetical protein
VSFVSLSSDGSNSESDCAGLCGFKLLRFAEEGLVAVRFKEGSRKVRIKGLLLTSEKFYRGRGYVRGDWRQSPGVWLRSRAFERCAKAVARMCS